MIQFSHCFIYRINSYVYSTTIHIILICLKRYCVPEAQVCQYNLYYITQPVSQFRFVLRPVIHHFFITIIHIFTVFVLMLSEEIRKAIYKSKTDNEKRLISLMFSMFILFNSILD